MGRKIIESLKSRYMNKEPFYIKFVEKPQIEKSRKFKGAVSTKVQQILTKAGQVDTKTQKKNTKKSQSKKLRVEKLPLFDQLTKEEYNVINSFLQFVDPVLKLNKKQKVETFKNIKYLFHKLTDERSDREYNYLNNPRDLSSYVYYYLWWNIYRLTILFKAVQLDIKDKSVVGDFGSGPLTSILALWISKPELRDKEITFYCVDISSRVMKLGEDIFYSLVKFTSNKNTKWKIKRVQGSFPILLHVKLSLFISCNMFNEILWNKQNNLKEKVKNYAKIIDSYLEDSGSFIVVEPGLPIGGAIVCLFRRFFLEKNYKLVSPCPHSEHCPLHEKSIDNTPVAKNKWCHFAFSTSKAPKNLLKFSENVGLNKNIASFSYMYCNKSKGGDLDKIACEDAKKKNISFFSAIITSNIIKLSDKKIGRYACSGSGFLLLEGDENSMLQKLHFGSYVKISSSIVSNSFRDAKTGAVVVKI